MPDSESPRPPRPRPPLQRTASWSRGWQDRSARAEREGWTARGSLAADVPDDAETPRRGVPAPESPGADEPAPSEKPAEPVALRPVPADPPPAATGRPAAPADPPVPPVPESPRLAALKRLTEGPPTGGGTTSLAEPEPDDGPRPPLRVAEPDEPVPQVDWRLGAWLAGALVVLVTAAAGLVLAVRAAPGVAEPDPPVMSLRSGARPVVPQTLLAVLTDWSGRPVSTALLNVGERRTVTLVAPPRVLVTAPGGARRSLGAVIGADADGGDAAQALSRTAGVRVDGTWVLSPPAVDALVGQVGGVSVPRAPGIRAGAVVPGDGGERALTAGNAASYAIGRADEREAQRLARFASLLCRMLKAMPADDAGRRRAIAAVPEGNRSTLPLPSFVRLLGTARQRAGSPGAAVEQVLPVRNRGGRLVVAAAEVAPLLRGRDPGPAGATMS